MKKGTTRVIALLIVFSVLLVIPVQAGNLGPDDPSNQPGIEKKAYYYPGYDDVAESSWYASAVRFVTEKGYMDGLAYRIFGPDEPLTRAQLVTILYRIDGRVYVSGPSPYKDVPRTMWCSDAIIWATKKGIVNGYDDGRFYPDRSVTREQIMTMIYRYVNGSVNNTYLLNNYPDGSQVSSFAREAICWGIQRGILTGVRKDGRDYLMPNSVATRAQFAVMLQRWKG